MRIEHFLSEREPDPKADVKFGLKFMGGFVGTWIGLSIGIPLLVNNAAHLTDLAVNFADLSTARIPERAPFQAVLPEGIQINLSKTPTNLLGGKK